MTRSTTATVLLSGGIDSAAAAHHLLMQGFAVEALFVDYGQAAQRFEARAAASMAKHLDVSFQQLTLSGLDVSGPGELVGRNAFLISAALFATKGQSNLIGLGLHAGTPYYDCSHAFVTAIGKLVAELTDGCVSIVAPFLNWTKKDVYDYFRSASLPVDQTYSCEAGTEPMCGLCASCRDRRALGC